MKDQLRVLSLQPFYGGSHKQFIDGWINHSCLKWTSLALPPRHWKWRMRHASMHFAAEISQRFNHGERWDVIFCTDMMNVAELKGMIPLDAQHVPVVLYFHENQFAYPNRENLDRDLHFSFTNFVSAVAADRVWFNSEFNFSSMIQGARQQSEHWPDHVPIDQISLLENKFEVQPPGIETPSLDWQSIEEQRIQRQRDGKPIHLVWAARWEHDKNPDDLLSALVELQNRNLEFRLSVIGESFAQVPPQFLEIHDRFGDRIVDWGFQTTRELYWQALARGDVFVSTANHEFFGIAVAEGIMAGLIPLLPNRLAYPELLGYAVGEDGGQAFLYDGSPGDLANRIELICRKRDEGNLWAVKSSLAGAIQDKLGWSTRAAKLDDALIQLADRWAVR